MVAYCTLLLTAGNETTTNLIGAMVVALLDNPDQLDLLVRRPELIPQAVEEGLRYCSPVQALYRRATRDLEIAGTPVKAGQDVALCFCIGKSRPGQIRRPRSLRYRTRHLGSSRLRLRDPSLPRRASGEARSTCGAGASHSTSTRAQPRSRTAQLDRIVDHSRSKQSDHAARGLSRAKNRSIRRVIVAHVTVDASATQRQSVRDLLQQLLL